MPDDMTHEELMGRLIAAQKGEEYQESGGPVISEPTPRPVAGSPASDVSAGGCVCGHSKAAHTERGGCFRCGWAKCQTFLSDAPADTHERDACGCQSVMWNPYNRVVQCHRCGLTPSAPTFLELGMDTQEPVIENAPQDPYLRHANGEPFMSYYTAVCMVRDQRYLEAENRLLRKRVEELIARREELHELLASGVSAPSRKPDLQERDVCSSGVSGCTGPWKDGTCMNCGRTPGRPRYNPES